MDDLKPTHIEVTFKSIHGNDINGYYVDLGLVECSHCFCAVPKRSKKDHLAWHRKAEKYPPSTEFFYYDTSQYFTEADPPEPPPEPKSVGEAFTQHLRDNPTAE